MNQELRNAFVTGADRMAACADLLDNINVFPVADGDTGRNLLMTLSPLRQLRENPEHTAHQLLLSARGNSGNIAACFFSGFLTAKTLGDIPRATALGRERAWKAVSDPRHGTMLTLFDALAEVSAHTTGGDKESVSGVIASLEAAVRSTPRFLPILAAAGVADAGALGMFIYLEGFFKSLAGTGSEFRSVNEIFRGMLRVSPSFSSGEETGQGYCVDMVIRPEANAEKNIRKISEYGESAVIIPGKDCLKIHMHTHDAEAVRKQMEDIGEVIRWSDDDIDTQIKHFSRHDGSASSVNGSGRRAVHIMTDAAGSLTREDSRHLGITLLDSYISVGDKCLPETFFSPSDLYASMKNGMKVSTSQASIFERHQCYQSVLDQYERVLYLCVGSVYTGNYDVVTRWKKENDHEGRLRVIDTTAASGRLGAIVMATAKYSDGSDDPGAVADFARKAVLACEEYVFLDSLRYLAAGGRLSKTGAFFGDMFRIKPVISPTAEGAKKVGAVRNEGEQVKFALERLSRVFGKDASPFIMLEYSDNISRISRIVRKEITKHHPGARILLQPLSLTSGAHMGPGTWAMAFLPEKFF